MIELDGDDIKIIYLDNLYEMMKVVFGLDDFVLILIGNGDEIVVFRE